MLGTVTETKIILHHFSIEKGCFSDFCYPLQIVKYNLFIVILVE